MKRSLSAFVFVGLSLAACGPQTPADDSRAAAVDAIPVQTVAARARTVDRTIEVVGSLVPAREATLAAEVDGQVREMLVDIGDRVAKGDAVARIDSKMHEAALRETEARLASARADAERAEQLRAGGVVSEQESDRLRAARDAAAAERDLLALRVERSTIRAPIAGAVTARLVDVGDYAHAGTALVTIADDHVLRLRGEVPERFVAEIVAGLEVRGEVDAYPGLTVKGKVARRNGALDAKSRSLTIEAEIENPELRLRPGFFVRATIVTQRGVATVTVPSPAVVSVAGVSHLYVLADGAARSRDVQLGDRIEEDVEIISGCKEGESVIVSGLGRLYDGAPVRLAVAAEARR